MANQNILVVDDEQNILNNLKRLLEPEGYKVFTALSAEEALERLKEIGEVGLIISDNRLPGKQGVDFLLKARQLYPDSIRILFTGYADLESAVSAINKGQVYRYVLKPWDNDELKLMVKYALDYYTILKENRLLLRIAKQQAEWLKNIQDKYPGLSQEEIKKIDLYSIEEKFISEALNEFLKKYYPQQEKPPEL